MRAYKAKRALERLSAGFWKYCRCKMRQKSSWLAGSNDLMTTSMHAWKEDCWLTIYIAEQAHHRFQRFWDFSSFLYHQSASSKQKMVQRSECTHIVFVLQFLCIGLFLSIDIDSLFFKPKDMLPDLYIYTATFSCLLWMKAVCRTSQWCAVCLIYLTSFGQERQPSLCIVLQFEKTNFTATLIVSSLFSETCSYWMAFWRVCKSCAGHLHGIWKYTAISAKRCALTWFTKTKTDTSAQAL